jgi:hypothetical protein
VTKRAIKLVNIVMHKMKTMLLVQAALSAVLPFLIAITAGP